MKSLGTVVLSAALSLLPAAAAKADVWMLEILSLQPGVASFHVDSYMGAVDLVARRHGGVRVSRFHTQTQNIAEERPPQLVGMWRFPNAEAMQALLADPAYASIYRLRQRTFDTPTSETLQLVADRTAEP
ncbi:MAG TPA: DUF1330 domain-containing protein [Myxococcota bacterium]|nr:DUF1330 domain-containing protein [Myxococcota bacterium]